VRPRNHKLANQAEQLKWQSSYIIGDREDEIYHQRRAPTYGTCDGCWASGLSYQPCQECDNGEYMPLELKGYIIDSQSVATKLKKPHHTARAGLTYNVMRTDMMKFNRKAIKEQLIKDHDKEHPYWKDHEDEFQFALHQKSYAERGLVTAFFGEYDALLNFPKIQRLQQEQERVGGKRKPGETVSEDEIDENPKKKSFRHDTTKEG
jgi:hypothetical protein